MALTATMYTFLIDLSNVDRGVYANLELRVAQQPSETDEYLLTRVLAYCLEYEEGIAFSAGISAGDEPAISIRSLTGELTAWIEVGAPDAARLHRASKSTERVAVYTHRSIAMLKQQLAGNRIHRAADIPIYEIERPLLAALVRVVERRTTMSIVVTEGQLYIEVGGEAISGQIREHRLEGV